MHFLVPEEIQVRILYTEMIMDQDVDQVLPILFIGILLQEEQLH